MTIDILYMPTVFSGDISEVEVVRIQRTTIDRWHLVVRFLQALDIAYRNVAHGGTTFRRQGYSVLHDTITVNNETVTR